MLHRIGKYELIEEVGRGGMAVVYRAKDTSLNRIVALKLLHPYLAEDHQAKIRLETEAQAVASLRHPLIPEVYDFSGHDSEHAYIVTEYVDGVTLAKYLKTHSFSMPECALLILHRIVEALDHAHKNGIVHRDLKPENIMITGSGEVRLMDFGISRVVENPGITSTGQILGSPAYMAPEIVRGQIADEKSDIFACGILLYQMTCGILPFTGTNPHAVLVKIAEVEYDDPEEMKPDIGNSVSRFIRRLLSKDPKDRPVNTTMLLKETEEILEYSGIYANDIPDLSKKVILRGEEFEKKLKPRIVKALIGLTVKEGSSALAHQTINRLLCIAPENTDVKRIWDEIYEDDNRLKIPFAIIAPVAVIVLIAIVTIFFFTNRTSESPIIKKFTKFIPGKNIQYIPIESDNLTLDSTAVVVDDNYSYSNDVVNNTSMDNKAMDVAMKAVVDNKTPIKNDHSMMGSSNNLNMNPQPMPAIAQNRTFTIFPFPQGKVKVFLNGKLLGFWGPPPGINSVSVGDGSNSIMLTHPLCYSRTITIPENMKSGKINARLSWKPARIIVEAPSGSAIAVKTLEGTPKTIPGIAGSPLEVVFPPYWEKSNIRVKVIIASRKFPTKEKIVYLIAGRVLKIPFSSFK